MSDDKPEWYRVPYLAKRLDLSPMTLYRLLDNGEIPGQARIGEKTIRVNARIFDAWLDGLIPPEERTVPMVCNVCGHVRLHKATE